MISTRPRTLCWSSALIALLALSSCRKTAPPGAAGPVKLQASASIDLGVAHERLEGFFDPERVGRRSSAWSQGQTSVLPFELKPESRPYLLALLIEPYFGAQPLTIGVSLNERALGNLEILPGWRAYQLRVDSSALREGSNELTLSYSKTVRPADVEPGSSDVREIAVRVDQVQLQPIGDRVELALDMKDAIGRAAMTDGWAIDENDRYAGVWTLGRRTLLNVPLTRFDAPAYALELTAHTQSGAPEQSVRVQLNGTALGTLKFGSKRAKERLEVSRAALAYDNVIDLSFDELTMPSQINPLSKDQRLLGLRLLRLDLVPQ